MKVTLLNETIARNATKKGDLGSPRRESFACERSRYAFWYNLRNFRHHNQGDGIFLGSRSLHISRKVQRSHAVEELFLLLQVLRFRP